MSTIKDLSIATVAGLVAACALGAGAGCGSDGSGADPTPAAPAAAAIEVQLTPRRSLYRTEQLVTVAAEVTDASGAVITGAPVSWSAAPAGAATPVTDGAVTLLATGRVAVTACVTAEPTLCDTVWLLVDDGAPLLELTAPEPGAELGSDGAAAIEVTGSVAGDARVFVNGAPVTVNEVGEFAAALVPRFGINHVEVVATDGFGDQVARELDVLWADGYTPAVGDDGQPHLVLDDGLALQLGQSFFDDEVPLALDQPVETRDLADILELVVANVDFASELPDPVVDSRPTMFLRVPSVTLGDVRASVEVTDGGVELVLRIGDVVADTEGELSLGGAPLDLTGGIVASLSVYARLEIAMAGPDAPPSAAIEAALAELSVAVESAEGRFGSDEANAVFRLAEGVLRQTLEGLLLDAFGDTLASALPSLLTGALGALDTALRDQTVDIDTDIFPKLTLALDGRIASLATAAWRYLRATLRTKIGVTAPALHPDSRGVAQLAAAPGEPLFASTPVQLAVRLDLLNGLVHGLWNAGLLDFDATAILPDSLSTLVSEAQLRGGMAPVIRPARGGEPYDLVLELGQLELSMLSLGERTTFGLSLEAGVSVAIVDGAISLEIAEEPAVRVWMIATESDVPRVTADLLDDLLRRLIWPELRGAIADGLSIELPALDVGSFADIAPALAGFALSIELVRSLDVREGSLVFDVALVGRLP